MLKCAVQVMRWRDTRAHRPAICTRNRCTHCTIQWATAPGRSLNYPRPKFITHTHTVYQMKELSVFLHSLHWNIPVFTINDHYMLSLTLFHRLTDEQITIQSICVIKGLGFQSFLEMPGNLRQYAKWLVVTGITRNAWKFLALREMPDYIDCL